MVNTFEGETADQVWRLAANRIASGVGAYQPGRGGPTRELLHALVAIRNPLERWVLSRVPPMNPAFAIAEVVWIMSGSRSAHFVNHWNPALPRFAGRCASYHGAYGQRLRDNLGFDQLERAFAVLSRNPESRQVVLQIWDARIDLPDDAGMPSADDVPCNIVSMLKVRNGHLHWTQIMRSNDLHLGLPHNIVQFTTLQEVLAGWLGLGVGQYVQLSDSLHVYERDLDNVCHVEPIAIPETTDSLRLPKAESDHVWRELLERMNVLAQEPQLTRDRWKRLVYSFEAPGSFQNLMYIAAADDARRRGWAGAAEAVARQCANPVLRLGWERWALRQRSSSSHRSQAPLSAAATGGDA